MVRQMNVRNWFVSSAIDAIKTFPRGETREKKNTHTQQTSETDQFLSGSVQHVSRYLQPFRI